MNRIDQEKYQEIIKALRGESEVFDKDMVIQMLEDSIDDKYLGEPLRNTFDAIIDKQ